MSKMANVALATQRVSEIMSVFWSSSEADRVVLNTEYEQHVTVLLGCYGSNADVNLIDPMLGDIYSDCYKDHYGVRPRGHSYATAKAFMDNPPTFSPLDDEDEGDRFDPDISGWNDEEAANMAQAQDAADVYGFSPFACLRSLVL